MKMYTVDMPVQSWIVDHCDEIYTDILTNCEGTLKSTKVSTPVDVALLKTQAGITKFVIKDIEGVQDSLERAMSYFVEVEKYEEAARTRDCMNAWKKIDPSCQSL